MEFTFALQTFTMDKQWTNKYMRDLHLSGSGKFYKVLPQINYDVGSILWRSKTVCLFHEAKICIHSLRKCGKIEYALHPNWHKPRSAVYALQYGLMGYLVVRFGNYFYVSSRPHFHRGSL